MYRTFCKLISLRTICVKSSFSNPSICFRPSKYGREASSVTAMPAVEFEPAVAVRRPRAPLFLS